MPVINFSYSDLCALLGRDVPRELLREKLPMIGADMKSAPEGSDEMAFEFFPDRPDLYSVEGVARALRAFLGYEPGLRSYPVERSDVALRVDRSVESVRPFIWSAIVEGVEADDRLIKSMMDLQEKLHLTLGRNRRKVAIGIHDMSAVRPPFTYKAVRPDRISFTPLQGTRKMTLADVLKEHDKGRAYAFVLEGKEHYPVIVDSQGEVLSFPPIINGIATAVTESTTRMFIDCTGTDVNAVKAAVNIVSTALAERGGGVKTVSILREGASESAPDLTPRKMSVDPAYVNRLLGLNLDDREMTACLMRMGYGATPGDSGLEVLVPQYRADIIHPVDLAEDVAVGYGFERFGRSFPQSVTFGRADPLTGFGTSLRGILVGLGYFEVATLSLSNTDDQYKAYGLDVDERTVSVRNPVSEDHTLVRTTLMPSLMTILRKNKHRELPQRIFEVGDVVLDAKNRRHVAGASMHSKAGFTECKSVVQSFLKGMALEPDVLQADLPGFVPGRSAKVLVNGHEAGLMGEVSPATLEHFELGYPAVAFEFDLEELMRLRGPSS
jgi:phenylalanyl-tRNA synthetase beta chain